MSVRAAGIPVTSALSSPAILDILPPSAALPVMAVAILSVWAAHCAPEVSTVHEPASEDSPVHEFTPVLPEVAASAAEPPEVAAFAAEPPECNICSRHRGKWKHIYVYWTGCALLSLMWWLEVSSWLLRIVLMMGRLVIVNPFLSTDITCWWDGGNLQGHTDHGDRRSGGRGEHKEQTQEVRITR